MGFYFSVDLEMQQRFDSPRYLDIRPFYSVALRLELDAA